MPQIISNENFYRAIESTYRQALDQIQSAGFTGSPSLFIHAMNYSNDPARVRISLSSGYGSDEIKVDGTEIWAVVDEFCRRAGFKREQELVKLAPPVVEHPAGFVAETTESDIPF